MIPCRTTLSAATAVLVLLSFAPPSADAATRTRVLWHAASAVCDANHPGVDTSVRRQVNAFRNVGSEVIAVTCGTMTDTLIFSGAFSQVQVFLQNHKAVSASISCTINAGTSQDTLYTNKKTVAVAAGAVGSLAWTPAEYGNTRAHATLNCNLPAGWSIRDLSVTYDEYVGE